MSYRSGASSHKGHRSHKSKARTGAKVSRSRSRSASRKNKKSTRGKCVAGRIRDHRTHKCATCDDFDPVEVAQFLRLLGVAVSADHKENCRTLRAAVKPDRFDEVAKILMGVRKFDPLPGQDIYEERKYVASQLIHQKRANAFLGLPKESQLFLPPNVWDFQSPFLCLHAHQPLLL